MFIGAKPNTITPFRKHSNAYLTLHNLFANPVRTTYHTLCQTEVMREVTCTAHILTAGVLVGTDGLTLVLFCVWFCGFAIDC